MKREIIRYKNSFEKLVDSVAKEKDDVQTAILVKFLAGFATRKHTGYFSNSVLENLLLNISGKYGDPIKNAQFEKNSFLHVLTRVYLSGGHTRVVERWINNSDSNEKHSVILLNQQIDEIPNRIKDVVKDKNGNFINLIDGNYIEKALRLREAARNYEYIILHTHMDDPVPIMAFGREDFPRPVILFNQADHTFWLGCSIADIVAELREFGVELSKKRRLVNKSFTLSIPIELSSGTNTDKITCRKKINLPTDKKIILSMAAAHKYLPFGKYNFVEMAQNVVNNTENSLFVLIGPDKTDNIWNNAYTNSNGRILPIGTIPNSKVKDYINAADLYIDSFPVSSFTSLLDVAITGIPVLSLMTEEGHLDIISNSGIQSKTIEEITDRAIEILNGAPVSTNLVQEIINHHSPEGWLKNLKLLLENTPKTHRLNYFDNERFSEELLDEYDLFINNVFKSSREEETVPDIFDFESLNPKNRLFVLKTLTFCTTIKTRKFYKKLLGLYKRFFVYLIKPPDNKIARLE